jgi:hypothetical protein
MTGFVLVILAIVAFVYGFLSLGDLLQISSRPNATVFQQISAQLGVGMSLLVFSVSIGLASVSWRLGKVIEHLKASTPTNPAPNESPSADKKVMQSSPTPPVSGS